MRSGKEARIWARGDSEAPLGAEVRRGAGFVTAFASDVLLEGWTRRLVARLVDSALPTAEETPCWWHGDCLRFQAPASHKGEDLVLGSVERPVSAREVEVGVFEVGFPQTAEAPVALPVRNAQGALLARLLPPPRPDPEWGRSPLDAGSWQRSAAAPVAGGRRRWPILLAALLLLSCLAATRRQENHLP